MYAEEAGMGLARVASHCPATQLTGLSGEQGCRSRLIPCAAWTVMLVTTVTRTAQPPLCPTTHMGRQGWPALGHD